MSQPGCGPPAVPPVGGERPGWPTTPPPLRPLGPGDPAEVGPYRLEAVLGAGGMGRVYLGRTPAGSAVAVKVVHREYAGDRAFRKRFEQEVAAARRVQGLYTVPVVDADLRAEEPWLVTAYVAGPSLHDAVDEFGPLPPDAVVGLVARVAEALQSIHAADVIHRDLKPSNIILTAEGPKVIDFGIARAADVTTVTRTGMLMGTPAYMAPEYIRGQDVTKAVDVFALGVVASFAATGRPAFGGGSHHSVTYRILEQAPDLDGCPEPVRTIAAGCLEKDPQRRPALTDVIRHCRPVSTTGSAGGEARTVAAPPADRTRVAPASGLHDAVTSPAPPPAMQGPRGGLGGIGGVVPGGPVIPSGSGGRPNPPRANPSPESSGPADAPTPGLPFLISGIGALVIVTLVVAVVLPGHSSDHGTPPSAKPVATLTGFPKGAASVAFSPDGKTLGVGVANSTVQLLDAVSHKRRATLTLRDSSLSNRDSVCVAFSPDGKLLAAGTEGGQVGLWDVAERQQVASIPADLHEPVNSVAFSPDSKLLAIGDEEGVRLWNVGTGKDRSRQLAEFDSDMTANQVTFSPNGKTLAIAGDSSTSGSPDVEHWAQLWDVSGRRVRKNLDHPTTLKSVAFSPDGKTLATAGEDATVRLWDVASGDEENDFDPKDSSGIDDAVFSPDGNTLAIGTFDDVRLWDVADGQERTRLVIHDDESLDSFVYLDSVAFSPNGRLLAATSSDGAVRLWKARQP